MKLKQWVLSISMIPFAGLAQADVIMYGQMRGGMEVESKKVGNTKLYNGTRTRVVAPGSRLGFKGKEKLSGSLNAVWQIEQRINLNGNGSGFANRDSYIGLEGGFGRVHFGYVNTPINEWSDGYLDPYQYSSDALGAGYWTRNSSGNDVKRRRTAMRYYTPRMGGLMMQAYVSPSNNAPNNDENVWVNSRQLDKGLYGVGLDYKHKNGFFTNLVGAHTKNGGYNPLKDDAFQAIAQFGVEKDHFTAGLAYQFAKNVDAPSAFDANIFDTYVAANAATSTPASGVQTRAITRSQEVLAMAAFKVAPNLRLRATAAHGFDIKALRTNHTAGTSEIQKVGGNGKYWQGVVGAQYTLSKRTDVYTQVGYINMGKGDEKVRTAAFGLGMRHRF